MRLEDYKILDRVSWRRTTNLLQRGRHCDRDSGGEQENGGEKGRFGDKRAD